MNDNEREIPGLPDAERELAARLDRLGSLMGEQVESEAEIDQSFARNLRAHLLYGEQDAPSPGFARNLRSRLMRLPSARPVRRPPLRRATVWIGTSAIALGAVLVALLVALLSSNSNSIPSFKAPQPRTADLVFSFPAPTTAIHTLSPTGSLVHPRPGVPYRGHLRLSAGRLPTGSPKLRAYRLTRAKNVAVRSGRLLRIRSHVRRVQVGSAFWMVAADGRQSSHHPLHSLAVSLSSGELIYHDRRNFKLARAAGPLNRRTAVSVGRQWLRLLGWPANRMPLTEIETAANMPKVREVEFGWADVGATATDAATLWVTPDRSIIEAWLWPPVQQGESVPARAIAEAWIKVRGGKLPFAVEGISAAVRSTGVGALRSTSVVSVLTADSTGREYLVPTYRFAGKAHIPGGSIHPWYSLVPSSQK